MPVPCRHSSRSRSHPVASAADIAETLTIHRSSQPAAGATAATTTAARGAGRQRQYHSTAARYEGYKKNESQGLDQLIQGTQGGQQSSPPPDNQEQPDFRGQSNPN